MKNPIKLQENVSLAPLTTFKIGGEARYFVEATLETDVIAALELARERGWEVFVLGGGSNVLVADGGFDGLVIHLTMKRSSLRITENEQPSNSAQRVITAGAGENWDEFVKFCVQNNLAGVECLSGIPGSVGGTPVQNVGAYGQEVSETIVAVRCIDRKDLSAVRLTNRECEFSYRQSTFNSSQRNRFVVYDVTFAFERGGRPKIEYKDLVEYFDGRQPTLAETREAVLDIRRAKSMVIDATDVNSQSAGSFFKNPVLEREQFEQLRSHHERVPSFDFEGRVKIPAAWLIENAGFQKGYEFGRVGLSSNHVLAIVNRGGGTAREVLELKRRIESQVMEKFGILLYPEPQFIGFSPSQ